MADIVYVESGYLEPGYTVYTAAAGSSLTSTARIPDDPYTVADYVTAGYFFTPTLDATRIRSISLAITVVGTTTVSGARSRPGASAVTATVTQSTSAERTRSSPVTAAVVASFTAEGRFQQQGSADLASTWSTSITATATKPTGADLTAFDTIAVTALANKNFDADLASAFSVVATPSVTRDAGYPTATVSWDSQDSSWDDWQHLYWDPDNGIWISTRSSVYAFPVVRGDTQYLLESEFAIYPNGGHLRSGSAAITENNSGIFAIGGYEKSATASAVATASLAVPGEKLHSTTSADFATVVAVSVSAEVIPPTRGEATLAGSVAVSALGGKLRTADSTMSDEFVFVAFPKIGGIQEMDPLGITARFAIASTISRNLVSSCAVTATVSQTTQGQRTRNITLDISCPTTVDTQFTRIRPGASAVSIETTQSSDGQRIRFGSSSPTVVTNSTALGGYSVQGLAVLASEYNLLASGGRLRTAQAQLSALGFTLTAGEVYWFDPDLVLMVQPETRYYPVLAESRSLPVVEETRVNMVLDELRTLDVPEESRTLEVIA